LGYEDRRFGLIVRAIIVAKRYILAKNCL